jgi:cytochrome c-type biogenesis protein CcmH
MRKLKLLWLLMLLPVLVSTSMVFAQAPDSEVSDDDVNRVARELYCPICENTPLDVCETQACEDWRELIREKLATGQSDQEIITYFAEIYGERARATPTTRGLSLAVWIVPVIGAIVGVAYFARLLRRWLARGSAAEPLAVPSPTLHPGDQSADQTDVDDYVTRLEREIRESS